MIYNEREARKQLPKGDLSHTESYIVVFNAFDPKDGIWKSRVDVTTLLIKTRMKQSKLDS